MHFSRSSRSIFSLSYKVLQGQWLHSPRHYALPRVWKSSCILIGVLTAFENPACTTGAIVSHVLEAN